VTIDRRESMKGFISKRGVLLACCLLLTNTGFAATATTTNPTTSAGSTATNPPLPTPIGRVIWIKGALTAVMQNNETRSLQKKSVIYLHDVLKTDDKSQAGVVFTDNTLVTIKEGTEYTVDKYVDKQGAGNGNFIQTTTTGGLRAVTGFISKNSPNNFKINTPVALIGIRGTDFQFVLKDGKLFMAAFKGQPCLTNIPTEPNVIGKEVCLDKNHPYAQIIDRNKPAEFVDKAPDELGPQLSVVTASIGPFQPPPPYKQVRTIPRSGVIDSFCISN
jgi:hypothetical protein